ncbi:MAG: M23 family metallopeptidase [Chloroflexota bacterium]
MSKLGAHVNTGARNGFGEFCAAKPAVILSTEGGALVEARQLSGGHTITIYRDTTVYQDVPANMDHITPDQARQLADTLYPQLKAKWLLNPADYYTTQNEPAGNDEAVMPNYVAYEERLMELAEVDGFRLCILNLSGGTPGDIEVWKRVYVPHIQRAFAGGHIYGRHAYGGDLVTADGQPFDGNVERPLLEAAYLRSLGLNGGVALTELGLEAGFGFVGVGRFVEQVTGYEALLQQHSNIIGGCLWTLGDFVTGGLNANWQSAAPDLAEWMAQHPSPRWTPTAPLPGSGGAGGQGGRGTPRQQYHRVYQVIHPALSDEAAFEVFRQGLSLKRTTGWSFDDAGIGDLERRTAEIYGCPAAEQPTYRDWYAQYYPGVQVVFKEVVNGGQRLRLTMPLSGPYLLTSRLNDPRDYDGDGVRDDRHEGVDFAPLSAGSKVLAAAAGTVDRVRETDGYGKHVVLRHSDGDLAYFTWYAHLAQVDVAAGQVVAQKDPLGLVGRTGNATGDHVHFSLQVVGQGLSGFVIPDVVDPLPYLDLTVVTPSPSHPVTPSSYHGPALAPFVAGVDQPASDWHWPVAKAVFEETGFSPKFHTNGVNSQWYNAFKHPRFNLVRVLLDPAFGGNAEAIFNETITGVRAFYDLGARDFALLNEPNIEGLGLRWQNGAEYGRVFKTLCQRYREALPDVRLWFPGCSPGFGAQHAFIGAAKAEGAFDLVHGVVEHVYTGITNDAAAAVAQMVAEVKEFQQRHALDKPLAIGEFSVNRPATAAYKAEVYGAFYDALALIPGLQAAYAFTASWHPNPDANQEGWLELGIHNQW